tara:strand:- start:348 stop:542 length:195 start_codon:yes stop_codon:yes gene_type:complete
VVSDKVVAIIDVANVEVFIFCFLSNCSAYFSEVTDRLRVFYLSKKFDFSWILKLDLPFVGYLII